MPISISPNILFITIGRKPDSQILAEQYNKLSGGSNCEFVHLSYAFPPGPREILSLIEEHLAEGRHVVFDNSQSSFVAEEIKKSIYKTLERKIEKEESWKNKSEEEKIQEAKRRLEEILKRFHVLYD